MSLLVSILNVLRKISKIKKKLGNIKKITKKDILKIVLSGLYPIIIEIMLVVIVIAISIYSVTGAVGELFNGIKKIYGSSSSPPSSFYEGLSSTQISELMKESGANLDPKKVPMYIKRETESVPSSITGTKITESGANGKVNSTKNEIVSINTQSYVNKYKLNWEFIAAVDLASFNANDSTSDKSISGASSLYPVFDWNKTYSRDTTNYEKTWIEIYEYDPTTGKTTKTKDTSSESSEMFTTVKEPLAIPNKVSTLFGDYIYTVKEDKIIKDSPYSKPYVINQNISTKVVFDKMVPDYSKPIYEEREVYIVKPSKGGNGKEYKAPININTTFNKNKEYEYIGTDRGYYVYENGWWIFSSKLLIKKSDIPYDEVDQKLKYDRTDTERVFTGRYKEKKQYKTLTITTKTMKKTKQKIVEDKPNEPSLIFNPSKFIKYLNDNNLSVKDIDLIKEILMNIPNSNTLLDYIERIASGSYGDIGDGATIGDGTRPTGGYNFYTPLFIQWDERWGKKAYAGETIGAAGCAPTSMAMVITGLGGNMAGIDLNGDGIVDPSEAAEWSTKNGHAAYMQGSYDSLITSISKAAGLTVEQTYNANNVYEALKKGKLVVANVMPGTIINGHHFLVLTGVNFNGSISMNDPYSKENSLKEWSLDVIKKESKNFWIIDNPNADIYNSNLNKQNLFIAKVRRGAVATYYKFGVLPSVTIAQAIEESGWGESKLGSQYNNLFGIKADASWTGEKVALKTGEDYDNYIVAYFRVYDTWDQGIYDHGLFLYENSRYGQCGFFKATDYKGQTKALQDAGYATLKDKFGNLIYSSHLNSIIETYELNEIDEYVKKLKQ